MINFDAMQIGDSRRLPHPKEWAGENRSEYNRAQECTRRTGKLFSVETERNASHITGFIITRTQ